jgi:hypothetical protein
VNKQNKTIITLKYKKNLSLSAIFAQILIDKYFLHDFYNTSCFFAIQLFYSFIANWNSASPFTLFSFFIRFDWRYIIFRNYAVLIFILLVNSPITQQNIKTLIKIINKNKKVQNLLIKEKNLIFYSNRVHRTFFLLLSSV